MIFWSTYSYFMQLFHPIVMQPNQGIFMVDKFLGKDSIKPVYRSPESGKEPKGIKAVSALVQPKSTINPCNPNSCEHMCIVTSAESSGGLGYRYGKILFGIHDICWT